MLTAPGACRAKDAVRVCREYPIFLDERVLFWHTTGMYPPSSTRPGQACPMPACLLLPLLCLLLCSCAGQNPAVALGVGSHGAGVALFTDNLYLSPHFAGVQVGVPLAPRSYGRYESGTVTPGAGTGVAAVPASPAQPRPLSAASVPENAPPLNATPPSNAAPASSAPPAQGLHVEPLHVEPLRDVTFQAPAAPY